MRVSWSSLILWQVTLNVAAAAISPPFSFTNIYFLYTIFFFSMWLSHWGVAQAQGLRGLPLGRPCNQTTSLQLQVFIFYFFC